VRTGVVPKRKALKFLKIFPIRKSKADKILIPKGGEDRRKISNLPLTN